MKVFRTLLYSLTNFATPSHYSFSVVTLHYISYTKIENVGKVHPSLDLIFSVSMCLSVFLLQALDFPERLIFVVF